MRAFQRAGEWAASQHCESVEPTHLLWALWCEETRAAEILQQWPVEERQIQLVTGPQSAEADPYADSERDIPPTGTDLDAVRMAASELLATMGGSSEVGTEFLLWGLFQVESPVATAMRSWGITATALTTQICRSSGITTEPIAVDFEFAESSDNQQVISTQTTPGSNAGIERVFDAAANRAREGLRVVEDAVRFLFNDRSLTAQLKSWRHDLRTALDGLDSARLLASRDTTGDVGTTVQTNAEFHRQSIGDIVTANFKRTQEALRSLEEFSKLRSANLGHQFEQLRYRLYTLEKNVLAAISHPSAIVESQLTDRNLYVLLTAAACGPHTLEQIIDALSLGGVAERSIVQIREKSMPDRQLLEHARRVRRMTRERGILLIVNDRPDLAVLCDADGVHVGQDELGVRETRQIAGPNRLVGVSTHTIEQARNAVDDGADYIGVGPVFTSKTKPFEAFAGLEFVRQVAAEIDVPWYAIGGISDENIGDVIATGATRVAVCHSLCGADDPATTADRILSQLTQTQTE